MVFSPELSFIVVIMALPGGTRRLYGPLLCRELFGNLSRIRQTGIGVLLVEQNAKQSLAMADRGYLIENGRIIGEGQADTLLNDPAVQKAYPGAG